MPKKKTQPSDIDDNQTTEEPTEQELMEMEAEPAPVKTKTAKAVKADVVKSKTIKSFQSHEKDTGSTEVQVAVLNDKINTLAGHLQTHKKDVDSRMGLLKMISHRRSLLAYLEKKSPERYKKLIEKLGLRK